MTAAIQRAFAVWFEDLRRWSVNSFFTVQWSWPTAVIRPLSTALERKTAATSETDLADLRMVTLHFDGEMEPRDMREKTSLKGRLLSAEAGDVVYSKIDVRNGAIGVVPASMPRVAVTSEFPVYRVRREVALPEYIKVLFRAQAFRRQINTMISGASGRKRVEPDALESIAVPLPPLATQRAILAEWRKARQAIQAAEDRARNVEAEIEAALYGDLGTPQPKPAAARERFMPLQWTDLERWSFNYLWRVRSGLLGFGRSRFPIRPMEQCIVQTRNGFCIKPVAGPTPHKMLKLNALTPGGLDTAAAKYVRVSEKTAVQFHVCRGDLLICRSVGSYEHIAKCAVVPQDEPSLLYPDIMIRVRFNDSVLPDYVRELVQSSVGRSHFQSNARTAVGMWKIGAEDIRNFPLPLPPLPVQRRIMEKVAAGRERVAGERETARALARQIEADMEAYLLGTKKVPGAA